MPWWEVEIRCYIKIAVNKVAVTVYKVTVAVIVSITAVTTDITPLFSVGSRKSHIGIPKYPRTLTVNNITLPSATVE
jgi:hypothetical protein